jgi:hypothetical protein
MTPRSTSHTVPFLYPTRSRYFAASAFRAQSCSINCCARAPIRSVCIFKGQEQRIDRSRRRGLHPGFEGLEPDAHLRRVEFWAIHSGTTRPSTGCPGSEDRTGTARGLFPHGAVPVPDAAPVPLTEARDTGLADGVNTSLGSDGSCLEKDGPFTFAFGPRFDTLSDEAGPQPAIPARSN